MASEGVRSSYRFKIGPLARSQIRPFVKTDAYIYREVSPEEFGLIAHKSAQVVMTFLAVKERETGAPADIDGYLQRWGNAFEDILAFLTYLRRRKLLLQHFRIARGIIRGDFR